MPEDVYRFYGLPYFRLQKADRRAALHICHKDLDSAVSRSNGPGKCLSRSRGRLGCRLRGTVFVSPGVPDPCHHFPVKGKSHRNRLSCYKGRVVLTENQRDTLIRTGYGPQFFLLLFHLHIQKLRSAVSVQIGDAHCQTVVRRRQDCGKGLARVLILHSGPVGIVVIHIASHITVKGESHFCLSARLKLAVILAETGLPAVPLASEHLQGSALSVKRSLFAVYNGKL